MNRREAFMAGLGAAAALAAPGALAQGRRVSVQDARKLQDGAPLVEGLDGSTLNDEYLAKLEAAGLDVLCQSRGGFDSFVELHNFLDRHPDRIVQALTVRDIRAANQAGKIAHVSGWQSAEFLVRDGDPVMPAIGNLRGYKQLGLRIVGLVYNVAGPFGGGSLDPDVGITRAGKRLVEEIHKERLVLDVGGHTAEATSFGALEISKGMPVICSHTNLRSKVDNARNMTDKLIEAIAATGGVIGLTKVNDFHARVRNSPEPVTPQVGIEKHLDQYDYLKKLVGVDHIALGSDFMWGRKDLVAIIPELWPGDVYSNNPPWFMVKDTGTVTEYPNVTKGLMERGWTDEEIHKILGGNLLRVFEKVWGA